MEQLTTQQKKLKKEILKHISDVLSVHDDGTMGFCDFDTNGNIVHINYRLSVLSGIGVMAVYKENKK